MGQPIRRNRPLKMMNEGNGCLANVNESQHGSACGNLLFSALRLLVRRNGLPMKMNEAQLHESACGILLFSMGQVARMNGGSGQLVKMNEGLYENAWGILRLVNMT